jgi:anti-sigma28 factor (negative regulator of flagellin synthesis)
MLLFLLMTTLSMMPRNVWGKEIYSYTDKDGTIVITDKPPPQEDINADTKNSNSFQDSTSNERLHWGRDKALIDEQNQGESRQRKKVKADKGIEAGRYEVIIKKIASNLYQDISTRIIIKTRACNEPAGGDESALDWSGAYGELFFKKTNKSCMVKKVYK